MDSEEYKKLNNALFQRYVISKDDNSKLISLNGSTITENFITDDILNILDDINCSPISDKKAKKICREYFLKPCKEYFDDMDISDPIYKERIKKLISFVQMENTRKDKENEFNFYIITVSDAIFKNKEIPTELKEKVFMKLTFYLKESSLYTKEVLKELLRNNDLSDTFLKYIADTREQDIFGAVSDIMMEFGNNINEEIQKLKDISQTTKDRLCVYAMQGCKRRTTKMPLLRLASEETALKIFDMTEKDETQTAHLLCNTNISEKTRNELFDTIPFDPSMLYIPDITNHMGEILGKQIWGTLFDLNLRGTAGAVRQEHLLINLIENRKLPESMEIDLANRLLSDKRKTADDELEKVLTDCSDSEKVLFLLSDLKNKNRTNVFKNKNCPMDLIYKEFNKIIKQTNQSIKKENLIKTSTPLKKLYILLKNRNLGDEYIKKIYKTAYYTNKAGENRLWFLFTTSTSKEILKQFMQKEITIDGKIYPISQKDRMTASVLYTAKKENLKLNELDKLFSNFWHIIPCDIKEKIRELNIYTEISLSGQALELKDYDKYFSCIQNSVKQLGEDIDKEIKDRLNTYEYIITSISERKRYQNIVYDLRRGKINNPFCFDEEIKMTMDNKAIALFFIKEREKEMEKIKEEGETR